jgi:hypothetical protein
LFGQFSNDRGDFDALADEPTVVLVGQSVRQLTPERRPALIVVAGPTTRPLDRLGGVLRA